MIAGAHALHGTRGTPMHWSQSTVTHQQSTPPPGGLFGHAAVIRGNYLYQIGGANREGLYNDLTVFDVDTHFWFRPKVTGTGPKAIFHSATLVDERIFVYGGSETAGSTKYFDELYFLDTRTYKWNKPKVSGTPPGPRRAHSATLVKGKFIYVFGGGPVESSSNSLYVLDTETLHWTEVKTDGDKPAPRGHHTASLVGDKLLVFGGTDGDRCFGDICLLDIESRTWSKPHLINPFARYGHTAELIGNSYLFVFGGHDGTRHVDDFAQLSLTNFEWHHKHVTGTPPAPRAFHTAATTDFRMIVYGGTDDARVFDDVHLLDLGTYAYTLTARRIVA